MSYLLDTNVLSAMIRDPDGRAARTFARKAQGELATSIIAAAELRFGYVRVDSKRWERAVETVLHSLDILPWDRPSDMAYARLRTAAERQGVTVGYKDMLIAAHATAVGAILVSGDRVFPRIAGLQVENWLRAGSDDF